MVINLLELIRVKKAMIQTMKLVEQAFISKFKNKQLKKLNKKLKEPEDKIEKLTGKTTQ